MVIDTVMSDRFLIQTTRREIGYTVIDLNSAKKQPHRTRDKSKTSNALHLRMALLQAGCCRRAFLLRVVSRPIMVQIGSDLLAEGQGCTSIT